MRKYSFLFKPLFFIFNLLFASWLVLKIENISPSDFEKNTSIFQETVKPDPLDDSSDPAKTYLKKLFEEYRSGSINKKVLNRELDIFLNNISIKEKNDPVPEKRTVVGSSRLKFSTFETSDPGY